MKICTICHKEKSETEFFKSGRGRLRGECKLCGKYIKLDQNKKSKILYTKKFLISELERFIIENQKIPTFKDMKHGYPSGNTYIRIFNTTWNNVLKEANLNINCVGEYTKEFLISELHRYVLEYNKTPTSSTFYNLNNYPTTNTYRHHFGSWNNALIAANIKLNVSHHDNNSICYLCGSVSSKGCWKYDINHNLICSSCYNKNYFKTHPDKVKIYNHRHYDKRSKYTSTPINKPFSISEGHHLWLTNKKDLVIWIPKVLHQMYYHNHNKLETMCTINAIALDFWINEDFYYKLYELNGEIEHDNNIP